MIKVYQIIWKGQKNYVDNLNDLKSELELFKVADKELTLDVNKTIEHIKGLELNHCYSIGQFVFEYLRIPLETWILVRRKINS